MNKSRIFITGAGGFLGSWLAEWALSQGCEAIGCDNFSLGSKNNIPKGMRFYEYDARDLEKNKKYMTGCDAVFHSAAWPYDNFSLFAPAQVAGHNFALDSAVLSSAISCGVKRFVYCSSMSRYGEGKSPFTEQMPPRPLTPYGTAKMAGESLVKNLAKVHSFEYVICIPHNIFGPRQVYNDTRRNAVSLIVNHVLRDKSPVIYGDGEQKRGFSPIQDLIPLFSKILFSEKAKNQSFNIGPDDENISLNELLRLINEITGKNIKACFEPMRPQEVVNAMCCANKARNLLNYKKTISLKEALKRLIQWMQAQTPSIAVKGPCLETPLAFKQPPHKFKQKLNHYALNNIYTHRV